MKVYVYPADDQGCGSLRLIWPAQELQRQGHDITIIMPKQDKGIYGKVKGNELLDVTYPDDADVVVLQRVTHKYLAQAPALMQKNGTAVVIDMDDDLSCIHEKNAAHHALHPMSPGEHSWLNADRACADATLVTVSSQRLGSKYPRTHLLTNCIPRSYFDIEHHDSTLIGWAGLLATHPDDIPEIRIPVARLCEEFESPFHVIGNPEGVPQALGLNAEQVTSTGPQPIADWPYAITQLGIGAAPLADSRFNASKSWLKPLEYAALGVPSVMSPRAEYRALHKLGIGHLAEKPRQWYSALKRLITDDVYRQECSIKDREIARQMTIEQNAWKWLEAWESAYQMMNTPVSV